MTPRPSSQTTITATPAFDRMRRPALGVGAIALAGMVILLVVAPRAAAGGWLIAFVFWSGIPIGSLAALLIHTLTGGRWGERFTHVFAPTAATIPLLIVLAIPILAALPAFYPWAAGPSSAPQGVAGLYLNAPFFMVRTLLALIGWGVLAFAVPRLTGTLAIVVAGAGLVFHGLAVTAVGIDWILSLEPPFISTSFGATLAFAQLASAFAWALVLSPAEDRSPVADLAGLLLAALLGLTYINFMALLVIWYGDVPSRVFWFVERDEWPWTWIAVLAFGLAAVIPIFALFLQRVRRSQRALRVVGIIALVGIATYDAYLIAPAFGPLALGAAMVALIAIGALLVACLGLSWAGPALSRRTSSHAR
jgi:hypothetical protein